ncbi:MAG: hypothetical protein WDZ76_03960 [Pseudohongiellaceae bacterium]
MLSKETSFAKFSSPVCWLISLIMLLIAIFVFTDGSAGSAVVTGLLWVAGAAAFAVSAIYLSKNRSGQGE